MKVLPFTIPAAHDKTIMVQEDILPHFYPHLHRHKEMQLTLIVKGEGTLLVGNNMHPFAANEIYLIGANMPHVFKSDAHYFETEGAAQVYSLTIFFSTDGKLASLFELPEFKPVSNFLAANPSGFRVPQRCFGAVRDLVTGISDANGVDQFILFFQLLKTLSATGDVAPLSAQAQPRNFSDHEGMRISNIYNYIMQHCHRDLTLEEVAAAACMTPPAFCRYFKKHTRVTFVTFLNEVRINEACKKLLEGDYDSVSAVAYDCGFNSITNFNRVFKTATGKSPRAYAADFLCKAG